MLDRIKDRILKHADCDIKQQNRKMVSAISGVKQRNITVRCFVGNHEEKYSNEDANLSLL
jgi:hypothetical protein